MTTKVKFSLINLWIWNLNFSWQCFIISISDFFVKHEIIFCMFDQFRKVGKIFDIDLLIMIKLYNGLLVIKFILINILGFKISDKVNKIFEYFKKSILTKWYSFKKRIPVKKTKKGGMTVLKGNYSLPMEQKTMLELL